MAFVRDEHCDVCNKKTTHSNNRCVECIAREAEERKAAWHKLSLDDKLEDLRKRIEKLEGFPLSRLYRY
jgi:hypothetical protein